jgi:hypothetical protein
MSFFKVKSLVIITTKDIFYKKNMLCYLEEICMRLIPVLIKTECGQIFKLERDVLHLSN